MARSQKDLISRLADVGEEAIMRMGDVPGAGRFLDVANSMRERLDDMQKRMRGLDVLEKRVKDLEARVVKLERGSKSSSAKSTSGTAKSGSTKSGSSSSGSTASKSSGSSKSTSSSKSGGTSS